jgi:ankyrin repeat protein
MKKLFLLSLFIVTVVFNLFSSEGGSASARATCFGEACSVFTKNLFEAVKSGDLSKAESAIAEGADVNAKDDDGWTPLRHAVKRNNNFAIVQLLLKNEAKVELAVFKIAQDEVQDLKLLKELNIYFQTFDLIHSGAVKPLFVNRSTVEKIVERHGKLEHPLFQGAEGVKALSLAESYNYWCTDGVRPRMDCKQWSEILDEGDEIFGAHIASVDEVQETIKSEKQQKLMKILADIQKHRADNDSFRLFLTKEHVSPNFTFPFKDGGITPLIFLASMSVPDEKTVVENIKLLLDNGADIDFQNNNGLTALMFVVKQNSIIGTRLLLKFNPNFFIKDKNGQTVFDLALNKEIKELLLTAMRYSISTGSRSSAIFGSDSTSINKYLIISGIALTTALIAAKYFKKQ